MRIAVTTVSTGRPGFETPAGVYTILQKHREHFSNLYNNDPMPFMQRLTWDGIALHAGRLPGFAASHGCIRLPPEFARRLFDVSELGMTVVVANAAAQTPQLVHPGWLAPAVPGAEPDLAVLSLSDYWAPERAPEGPLTILVSTSEASLRVLRNGIEIGRTRVQFDAPPVAGLQVLQLQAGTLPEESAYVPGRPRLKWSLLAIEGGEGSDAAPMAADNYGKMQVAPEFARQVYDILVPGATVVITDGATETTATEAIMAGGGAENP